MREIRFLELHIVLEIHNAIIHQFGGSPGLRDAALLDSAINFPQASFAGNYLLEDLYAMAAAYAFAIIKNHAFIDGNKRTGMISAIFFLWDNGIKINTNQEEFFDLAIKIATSKVGLLELADILRKTKTI